MTGRSIKAVAKAGADSRKRRVLELVAEGRLNAEEAVALLRVGQGSATSSVAPSEPTAGGPLAIAVIGMAARFADADGVDAFWEMLRDGRSAVVELPEHRRGDKTTGRHPRAAFVPDPEAFDAGFFRISPTEAALMDPQQRLFLEQAYLALEDAGLGGEALSEARCGVYVGAGGGDYSEILKARGVSGNPLALMGNVPSILAARISYFLNLKGPSLAVDTACSSSLTALHLAVEALRAGTIDVALAGGVCVINTPEFMASMAEGGMLSPSDACHTFDAAADGFVCGEGAAAVVLKPLDRALADGDTVHGVIRASGSNQDGRTNGITAPSGTAQQALEEAVYRQHGIDPRAISYVETHGTGTPLGDPIEVDALTGAFRAFTPDTGFCRIGSVKTNIGHTLTAAGVAGLVKVLLMMRHKAIPASLNFTTPNPRIDFAASPFRVATGLESWDARPRMAALSSFGFSGTNAHVVVGEPPAAPARETVAGAWPVLLSARTAAALAAQAGRLRDWIAKREDVETRDVALTLGVGRGVFAARAGFVANDRAALLDGLGAIAEGRTVEAADAIVRAFVDAGDLPTHGTFDSKARRLALPGYPFERRRPGEAPAAPPAEAPAADPEALRRHGMAFGRAEDWGRRAMISVLTEMGLFATGRAAFTRAWARRHLGVTADRARLFDALVNIAARAGALSIEGDLIRPGPAPDTLDRAASRAALLDETPDAGPFLALLGATMEGLAAVLTGRRTAMEVLFPGGKGDLVEAVYRGNPLAEDLNARLVATLSEIAAASTGPMRVLEVGGGTGGATRSALAALAGSGREIRYTFTDVARAFVDAAPRTLAPAGGSVDFTALVFDIEGAVPPAVAGGGPFDVVIASNVLHATKRIAATLDRIHAVLTPGGALLANEVVAVQDFATLTFGLTDGWWAFEDADTRLPDAPVLSVEGWRAVLSGAGFPVMTADAITGPEGGAVQAVLRADRDRAPVRLERPATVPETPSPAPVAVARSAAPGGDLEAYLQGVVARVLTLPPEEVDRRGRFMDLGLDSILGVALVERLNADLGVDLRPTVVFDHPTVADLAAHLTAEGAAPSPSPARELAPAAEPVVPLPGDAAARDDRIAVIGISARFADAPDLSGFRAMLRAGRNAITEVPPSRWRPDLDESGEPNPFERWGGFLANAEGFDPLAMRISGKEAELTDPQHRVFLMEAWRALEDAGYGEAALDGLRCGIFVGAHGGDYTHRMTLAGVEPEAFAFMGNAASILAARISYMLNLKGPALALDTACSSSLVSVHAACRSILDGDCDMALAGGVFVTTVKGFNIAAGKAGMLSPNGRCATFDASADGFVPGEGAGAVLLKPLARALADGDNIQAVILGSGVNQDGKTNGITAPSPESQADLHRSVYRRHGIDPTTIGYVEAHGTGTPLGDPIEIEGLSRAWAGWTDARGICAVGSVKTNVGHAAHAAGIAGFVKAVLAVRDGEIHPSLHFRAENPRLRLSESPFRVPTSLEPWQPAQGAPRRAAVSSFGFSGTNCHIVVEQPPERAPRDVAPGPRLFLLSAKTDTALAARRAQLANHLSAHPLALDDVARTLAVGRTHFERRVAVVADSREALIAALRADADPASGGDAALDALARAYRAGEEIDVTAIAPTGRRVGLPTYPFELTPYWIEIAADGATPAAPVTTLAADWVPEERPTMPTAGRLLAVGDGPAAAAVTEGWRGGPASQLPLSSGVEALMDAARGADAVAVLGSAEADDPSIPEATGAALLSVVRGVLAGSGPAVPILLVHRGAPGEASLVAFGRSIAFLGGRAQVRALQLPDLDAATVLAEIGAGPRELRIVNGTREARGLAPTRSGGEFILPQGAPVLITGGGGALARLLAVRLVRRHGARIALVGRGGADDRVRTTIAEIETAGGTALYRQCDVADAPGLGAAIAEIEAAHGPLAAVYHLAGVASDGVVTDKSWADMRAVLRPKADGLRALDAALGDRPLAAFVVFTSLAAELGDFGQCDYALANAYADRFAAWREAEVRAGRRHGRTRAVGWPLWAEGRAVMSATGSKLFTEASGLRAIGTQEAFAALDAALAGDAPAVIVVPGDAGVAARLMEDRMTDTVAQSPASAMPASSGSGDAAAVAETLTALIAAQMKLPADRLARDANLADFGFDSIALKDFAAAISREYGIQLSPAVFFAHGSIDALAAHLAMEHWAGGTASAPRPSAPVAVRSPDTEQPSSDRAIAVIGLAGRFPGSPDVDAFWAHLEAGHDLIGAMPAERRDWGLANAGGPGGYLDGVDRFDYDFFGLPPRDALLMDPQHRLAIETAWNAVENAGLRMGDLAGARVGVFFASQVNEYAQLVPFEEQARAQMALGNVAALVANRISWLFDLRGPSETVDTACSGALVAVHRAVQALRVGEAEMALAGGVSVMLSPDGEETVRKLGVGSPDHRCFVFDARANGYVKGEGVGAVLLKPLDRALAEGDPVLAVIRGSAVGHGGHAQTLTAPNAAAQAEVITRAVRDAGIDPATIGYVEAHGTGTELGDPVEIDGLKTAFRDLGRDPATRACPVGSVKSNIGHLEPAAGIAGLAKLFLALRHRTIPASLHVETLNPLIDLTDGLVRIADRAEAWGRPADGGPRRAGLSSFGFGGANAHLVLEEAPRPAAAAPLAHPTLFVVSAADRDRLIARCEALAVHLAEAPVPVSALASTLMHGRVPLAERVAVRIAPGEEAAARLTAAVAVLRDGATDPGIVTGRAGDGAMAPGPATDALLRELLEDGALARIARLWVAGTEVDWAGLGLASGPRVALPGYPFHGPRCWFKGKPGAAVDRPAPAPVAVPVSPPAAKPAPASVAPPVPTVAAAEAADTIAKLVADALYVEPDAIDRSAGLADLGLDSILAVELVQAINQAFATDLQAARLYDHPTVEALAAYVTSAAPQPVPASPPAASAVAPPPATPPTALPAASPPAPSGEVFEEIRRIVADALYVEPEALDETAGFGDLGLDSILAVEVVQTINARWGIGLQAARLYDQPTVADLARHVAAASGDPAPVAAPPALVGEADPVLALLREKIGAALGRPAEAIDPAAPLTGFPIDPETAARILDELAATVGFRPAFEQVGRCPDLRSLAGFLAAGGAEPPVASPPPPAAPRAVPSSPPPPPATMPPLALAPTGDTVATVRAIVAEVLDVEAEALGLETPLADLGVDLVQAGEIAYRLNRRFGAGLKARRLIGFTGIAALAAALDEAPPDGPGDGARPAAVPAVPTVAASPPPPSIAPQPSRDAVAIVGIAARYPGAGSTAAFWEMIRDGRSAITEVPAARWSVTDNLAALSEPDQLAAVRWGGFVEDVDRFDPLFFGLSPKEAEVMDPQQRLFLEEAWHALEDAGLSRDALKGVACGVFVGGGQGDYVHLLPRDGVGLSGQMLLGNTTSILAARIAYFLDLKGPSLALDTACSSGLVATHYAVRSLLEGECAVALAGGVNLMLTPQMHLMTAASGMLAPDGKCKTFDDAADGFVPGEGLGVVVLKRLADAMADGDRIYATILGSAVNQDGRTSSITAPSAASQARLEAGLYARAGIDARRIGLVEAHGTGTKLGDPIEISALAEAFAESGVPGDGSARDTVAIGSVKTNIGHTLAAAGTAGLIKAALALRHATIPPSLHFTRPNGHIAFEDTPFRVATAREPLDPGRPLAAVSSFGFSGTNAHLVLAPPPDAVAPARVSGALAFPLSAPSEAALRRWAAALADGLAAEADLADIAHTLARRRSLFRARAVAVAEDRDGLLDTLRRLAADAPLATPAGAAAPPALAEDVTAFLSGGAPAWRAIPVARVADLPGYPFDRRRFWVETPAPAPAPVSSSRRIAADHPVLAGHEVGGRRLLPGVAALVLAREGAAGWIEVTDLVWAAPIEPGPDGLDLTPERGADGGFTLAGGAVSGRSAPSDGPTGPGMLAPQDWGAEIAAEAIYAALTEAGIVYGPEFRRIARIRVHDDTAVVDFTEPTISGTGDAIDTAAVGVLDAALHALAAIAIARGDPTALLMPARLDRAWIGPDVAQAAGARLRLRSTDDGASVTADADLLDRDGSVVARLRGLHAAAPKQTDAEGEGARTFLLQPRWVAGLNAGDAPNGPVAILVAAGGSEARLWAEALAAEARRAGREATVLAAGAEPPEAATTLVFVAFPDGAPDRAADEAAGVHRLLDLAKSLIAAGIGRHLRVVTRGGQGVTGDEPVDPRFAALSGFTRTLAREHPALDPVILDLPATETPAEARAHRALLLAERGGDDPVDIAYRGGRRLVRRLGELALGAVEAELPLAQEGVVLILGGAGGIGRAVSLDLARTHRARVVWVGRRARNADIKAAIAAVEAAGGQARYFKADAGDARALARVIKTVESSWGSIGGVIHATIVLADSRVETMDAETLDRALAPKSGTAEALAKALGDRRLDFLAVFSSSNALTCNPGQANYAAGCTAIDAWAEAWGRRTGVRVAVIDWGFWGETGIVARDDYRARAVAAGVDPMTTDEGLAIFRRLLGHGVSRAAVMRFAAAGRAQVERDVTRLAEPPVADPVPRALGAAAMVALDAVPPLDEDALRAAVGDIARIEEYGRRRLGGILAGLGALEPGTATVAEIAARAGVVPGYRRLLAALLEILARSGALVLRGDTVSVRDRPAADAPERPDIDRLSAHLTLLETCLDGLADVLRGRRQATDVMFPGGSSALVEAVYRDNPSSDPYNAILAATAAAMAAPDRTLRVIEIGAGTGGATGAVVDALRATGHPFAYAFTDVSPLFLDPARARFADTPEMTFAVLDIDADPRDQGVEAGGFDLVIAANVLHAAPDLTRAVDHAKALLAPGGALLLTEMTAASDLATLTFGLTEGWWGYADPAERLPHGPLLDPDGWRGLLHRCGFAGSAIGGLGAESGQSVVLALSDGWMPRHRAIRRNPTPTAVAPATTVAAGPVDRDGLVERLRALFAEVLKLDPSEIAVDEPYEAYGVDSLVAMDIRAKLETRIGAFPTPLLFEGVTLTGLAEVLLREKPDAVAALAGGTVVPAAAAPSTASMPSVSAGGRAAEPIAIVGMAGRYPGGENEAAFWRTLRAGVPVYGPVPGDRWSGADSPEPAARTAALIDGVDRFDPLFFQIAPAEAAAMDPQERLFLETAWAAIEDAGTTPGRLGGAGRRVGVYAGAMRSDYQRIGTLDLAAGGSGLAGSSFWSIANRVSHQLDFRGPSVAVDTACSAALHAIVMAVEALRAGSVEAALAGGVHLILHPQNQRAMAAMGLLSPSGRGRPFAADADGFVEGEGVGAVVLKRLGDAERDGDRVRAVILGGAVGSDGRSAGYMIPNPAAQADLLRAALAQARVTPDDIGHVEAQASGSPIGDPVEATALGRVFAAAGGRRHLATLKGVIGHLSAASGAAQLAKTVLQLEHGKRLPFAPPAPPHPDVDLSGFELSAAPTPWTGDDRPRIATITANGAGGATAVLVVGEAPPAPTVAVGGGAAARVFPLSAKTAERLDVMARRLADHLEAVNEALPAVAWTLQAGREAMAFRLAVVADDRATLIARLRAAATGETTEAARGKANGHAPTPPAATATAEDLARAWVRGAPVDWRTHWQDAVPRPVSLPTYPFERRRCWIEATVPPPGPPAAPPPTAPPPALPATRRAVRVARPGDIDDLAVADIPIEPPGTDEVVIAVETFTLNFGDLLSLRGSYPNLPPYPFTPGMEAVGRIVAVGGDVRARRIGDRVAAITGGRGGQADHVTVAAALTVAVPAALDPIEAAALPIAYLTARHALDRADLAAGETVLVTSAAGGVGPVLVQLARQAGARVLATVGAAAKGPAIEALGAEVLDYRSGDVTGWVRDRTGGAGADVVVNLLGGAAIQQGLDLLAPGGRYVEIALAGLMAAGRVDLSRLMDNQSLITVNLGRVLATPARTRAAMADLERALVEGRLTPLVDSVHRFEDLAEAYRRMAGRGAVGRIVVAVDPSIPARAPVTRAPVTHAVAAPPPAHPVADAPVPATDGGLSAAITAVAAGVLGLARDEIAPDRPLDELGLTSVSGLEIARRLEPVVGRPVPVTLLWQHRSTGALSAVLSDSVVDSAETARSPLVPIRETGDAAPLFLVHGAPGEVSWAVDLAARIGDAIPVYAFEAPGLHGDRPVPERVTDFAALYADLLQDACPRGPYAIGGYSGGGAIAFETTRILASRGRPASRLILLDANAPGTDSLKGMEAAFGDGFIHRLAANWLGARWGGRQRLEADGLAGLDGDALTQAVVDHLFATAAPPMSRADLAALIDGMDAVAGGIGRALATYEATAIDPPVPTLLIRCGRGMAPEGNPLDLPAFLTDGDYRAGWDGLVGGGVETVEVDCDHFSLVLAPHADRVAAAIRGALASESATEGGRDRVAAVVLEKVRAGLADVPPEDVVPERSMTDLGATSLDRVEVTLAAMEELGLDIPPRDLVGLANIDALIDVLHSHLTSQGPGE